MSCELYDYLKTMNFSKKRRCVYEIDCPLAKGREVNLTEIAESCRAIADEGENYSVTEEDLLQEDKIKTLISIARVN
ncbi:MAG: hypothetical protein UT58_C0027G0008 [Microgenomates group bacterium GW2011_GWC1_39_7b]|uniref:Uncharacterized protein n=3 Tax=Candidatus Woeseibacteriota TaxID=1752722 RepID=A0A0G0PQY5_9BACT|nr:MAG: hypothetical protein UT17_C0004G0114 [Candidatus Woesebacteria bacterium GW2011_GWB1_39_10]KKR25980.1 MAG: hypothetical protein UT58_C0027G0008 [Microgenomates group bacterium GW2011_GWC1_39_7b]KKR74376.1 MAG: hypothetical protein UU16_C0001G0027 [Candidatus Woesebacteria bacterium GW2011_GWA2_40_7]KKS90758.1 MAG: hypothetical protein UV66_C0001G0115 [Candidatus Woesebacteria bacterium GW2011_GWA1_43_12]